jgi:hypothetical protein
MFAIVYSKQTGRVRTVYSPGQSTTDLKGIQVSQGEALLTFNDNQYTDPFALQDLVTSKTGITPQNDRYAIVDQLGNVIGSVIADTQCGDSIPNAQLIAHPSATVGWTYSAITGFLDLRPVAVKVGGLS